jgi:TolB-like protein/predicted ATPase/predicted Ser/Thr protein kinase
LIDLPEDQPPEAESGAPRRSAPEPLRYAHFEVETGEDGYPVELGAGAMGVTYRARDTILRSIVALKVIARQWAADASVRARFLREARAAAQLHHPNVARVTYYGEQEGECFYVMEFVEGETLEQRVRRDGPLPPNLALRVVLQVARALAAAEACGVVHRDLKPSNLMIAARQGEADASNSLLVKLIDFGVAKVAEPGVEQTQAGFVGTPAFASPEQFLSPGQMHLDTRSDIYSLGITFWYLLIGRAPFGGRSLGEIHAHHSEALPLEQLAAARVPGQVIQLLESMLAFEPDDRPQSARELLVAVQECCEGEWEDLAKSEAEARRKEGFWIALLPFTVSGDSEIEEFGKGLIEEIVTGLSRFQYLRVIARSATERYLAESAGARRIGNELGARYVVEGNLRQAGSRMRFGAQLVDTKSGEQLWAETFERVWRKEDIFELQDEFTDRVVAPIGDVYGVLARAITARIAARPPQTLIAHEAVWRFFYAEQRGSAEEHLIARNALERAVEMEPAYTDARAALAILLLDEYRHLFNPQPNSLERARFAAQRALDQDPASQMANLAFAATRYYNGDLEAFHVASERALALNPRCSYTMAYLGRLSCYSGEWERGIQLTRKAIELSPHHPGWFYFGIFLNEYRQRRYGEAFAVLQRMNMPAYWVLHFVTAITHAQLGHRQEAQGEVERTLQLSPDFERFFGKEHLRKWFPNQPDLVDHVMEGVKLAGFRLWGPGPHVAAPGLLSPPASPGESSRPPPGPPETPTISAAKRHSVGRQKELAEMGRAFESAVAGQALFLCVTGEPGIGKSTLVEDFLSELAAAGRPYLLARGRCSERLAGAEAYLPILEAMESLLQGDGGKATAQVMKATAPNWYTQVAPPAAEDAVTRGTGDAKAATQERLKRELFAFLQELSRFKPLILFFDDLHWADASTVDLLAYLGGKCSEMCTLLLFTYRPTDLAVSRHPFGSVKLDLQARGLCRELALEFLRRPDLDRYLALEFPEHCFPKEFAALVHERTEGSPLFMADLLRYLRDRHVLALEEGHWRLMEPVTELERGLPESVRGMVQRKIDQLGDEDRRLLVAASVQGYEFDSAVVARVLERNAADVEERLDELDRVHAFVRAMEEHEFPDRTPSLRYRFVHVLYQNALYATLRPTRRAQLSASVAEVLLSYLGDKSAEVAAELALLLDASRDFARAAKFFLLAAQNAARIFANQEAVALARKGIEALASLPETPERARQELALQITLGPALFATKDWTAAEVEKAYTRAHVLCRELGESPDLFPVLWGLFLFRIARGEIKTGLDQGVQLLGLAERSQDSALLLQAHHALGPTYTLVGDWVSAQPHLDQAIAYYDAREHRAHAHIYGGHDPGVCCHSFAAKTLWMLGYPEQALRAGHDALVLARELGHPTSLAHGLLSIAILHQFRRDVPKTLELADELQKLASDQGLLFYLAGGSVLRGWALVNQGRSDEGRAQMREGFEMGGATRAHWRAYFLAVRAEACGKAGDFTEGLSALAQAVTVVEETGIRLYEPEMHRLQGEYLLALDPQKSADAEACFREAIAIAGRHQAKSMELRATASLARLWQQQDRGAEAHSKLAAIYGTCTEGFTTPDVADAAALLKGLA